MKITKRFSKKLVQKDGLEITIRPITPEDAEIEKDFVNGLSKESRYNRFFSGNKDLSPKMLERFTHVDLTKDMALIAVILDEEDKEKEIAVGRFHQKEDTKGCEFAIVIDDHYQGRGLGKEIMCLLIADASRKRYSYMDGEVLATNHKMISFSKRLGFEVKESSSGAHIVKVVKELEPPRAE